MLMQVLNNGDIIAEGHIKPVKAPVPVKETAIATEEASDDKENQSGTANTPPAEALTGRQQGHDHSISCFMSLVLLVLSSCFKADLVKPCLLDPLAIKGHHEATMTLNGLMERNGLPPASCDPTHHIALIAAELIRCVCMVRGKKSYSGSKGKASRSR